MWLIKPASNSSSIIFGLYLLNFTVFSVLIFVNVYDKTDFVIDEIFHYPQGHQYCEYNFTTWDPKITTLPGLYLVSTMMWGSFGLCSLFWLRATNLLAAILNAYLFKVICHMEQCGPKPKKSISWASMVTSVNLALLPPLYFFSHVYYTDTLSVTFILLTLIFASKDRHAIAVIFGGFAIMMRQTNIIWIVMLMAQQLVNIFVAGTLSRYRRDSRKNFDFWDVYFSLLQFYHSGFKFNNSKISKKDMVSLLAYFVLVVEFCVFVVVNGSIVVGDKAAHKASIHVPQLFYFSLFCAVFAFPHLFLEFGSFITYCLKRKIVCLCLFVVSLAAVHFNTLTHPYLLADNRHYTFYVWNRLYARYFYARYAMVIVYLYTIYALIKRADPVKNFVFLITFIPCTILVLTLQKMIDVRYFLIPFILLRLKFKIAESYVLIAESLVGFVINYITFDIFFTKEIMWEDFAYPQRLMW